MGTNGKNQRLHELAVRAKSGEREALEALLVDQEIKKVVYTIANREVGVENADDVYQDVRLRISQYIAGWLAKGEILNWIKGITRNVCIDVHRKSKTNWLIVTDTLPESGVEADQLQRISADEVLRIAETTFQKLGEECRRLLKLHVWQGIAKKTIMASLNMTKTTFYRKWNACYYGWIQTIQQILNL